MKMCLGPREGRNLAIDLSMSNGGGGSFQMWFEFNCKLVGSLGYTTIRWNLSKRLSKMSKYLKRPKMRGGGNNFKMVLEIHKVSEFWPFSFITIQ